MKKIACCFAVLVAVAAMFCAAGCDAFHKLSTERGNSAQGAPYELIVVCNTAVWDGVVGDTLRTILRQPVPAINQEEPLFDVMRVTPDGFKNIITRHRNIIKVLIEPTAQLGIGVQYDVSAHPQVVILIQGASDREVADYISENRDNLLYVLEKAERDRTIEFAEKYQELAIRDAIQREFGITMKVPKGYMLRNRTDDFLWASYEMPMASQGFFIYSYPYKGTRSLSVQALTAARNKFAALIPGPSDGSYMTTFDGYEPDHRALRIGGRLWIEMRGLWDVANDFMGGPFVSYSTVDTSTNRVVTLDCYVYSPKNGKRNYLRALEHLVYLIDFPEPESVSVSESASAK